MAVATGMVPATVAFAQTVTGKLRHTAVAVLCQSVDPRLARYGSYKAVVDAIYSEAGFARPDGRKRRYQNA